MTNSANPPQRHLDPKVSTAEWRWVLRWSLLIVVLCLTPYIIGYAVARPDEQFTGILMQDIDTHTYLAKIRLGLEGRATFIDRYTPEDHKPMPLYLTYVWWGLVSRPVTRDPAISYRLAQVVSILGALAAVYAFAALFFHTISQRRLAFLLVALGAGVGWATLPGVLFAGWLLSAVDLWMADATLFASMLLQPHFAAATALLLLTLWAFWLQVHTWSSRRIIPLILAPAAMVLIHPYLILTVTVIEGVYSLTSLITQRASWRALARVWLAEWLIMGPVFALMQGTIWWHPIARGWVVDQGTMLSPPPTSYVLGFGILLGLAIWGGVRVVRNRQDLLPVVWLGVGALLPYAPTTVQRRLIEGYIVPVGVLAAVAIGTYIRPWLTRQRKALRMAFHIPFTLTIILSNVILWTIACANATSHRAPWFVPQTEAQVWTWLREHGSADEVVLCNPELGNRIPAHTNKRVVAGHWAETVNYPRKVQAIESFFDPDTSSQERSAILREFGVRYVVAGPQEDLVPAGPGPQVKLLNPLFENADFTIFGVEKR
jgi:hypothetical protein